VLKIERSMAVVYGELDRFDEAWLVLPSLDVFIDTWERMLLSWTVMKLAFDAGDLTRAAEEVGIVYEAARWPAVVRCFLGDKAVEILLALGRQSEAATVVALTRDLSASWTNPHQMRMEGRVALGEGDLETAERWLGDAVHVWRTVRERPEEWRTRRALAEARLRSGDRSGAESELRDVLRGASKMGAAMETRQVRDQLARHGFDPGASAPPSEDVQLTGEKLVTVVFVDVRGYTATLRSQAPATLAERLAALYRLARDEVEARRGVIDKFAGDALMATFNVFGNHPNHCLHALQAVAAIRDKAEYLGFPVGAGIAVGSAIVGRLAQDANVSVIGEVTNLAARLQAKAAAGEILIDEEAFSRVRDWLQSERVKHEPVTLELAGFAEPVPAFRLSPPR
jgi:class 3 adenylate cyclase